MPTALKAYLDLEEIVGATFWHHGKQRTITEQEFQALIRKLVAWYERARGLDTLRGGGG